MIKGTTPTIKWYIEDENVNFEDFSEVWMNFRDRFGRILKVELDKLSIDPEERSIAYTFSQEETLKFSAGTIETQLRALFKDGSAYATKVKTFEMEDILGGGVIE